MQNYWKCTVVSACQCFVHKWPVPYYLLERFARVRHHSTHIGHKPSCRFANIFSVCQASYVSPYWQCGPAGQCLLRPCWGLLHCPAFFLALCAFKHLVSLDTRHGSCRWGAVSPGLRVILAFCRSCRSLYAAELLSDTPACFAAQGSHEYTIWTTAFLLVIRISVRLERWGPCYHGSFCSGFPWLYRSHNTTDVERKSAGIFSLFFLVRLCHLSIFADPLPHRTRF